jgi:hypothetical protein
MSLFKQFIDSDQLSSMKCVKINNSENYECEFCNGSHAELLFKKGYNYNKNIYNKNEIIHFFNNLGAIKCEDETKYKTDYHKWVIMKNNIDTIYTFGNDDDEFHITRNILKKYQFTPNISIQKYY